MRAWLDAILSVVLAPTCAACSDVLSAPSRGPVCSTCWSSILPLTPPLCETCGDPLPTWRLIDTAGSRCTRCRRIPRAVDRSRAIGAYDGALRSIVHALKYDGRPTIARHLAARMHAAGAEVLEGADLVVAVPLHRSRERARGFNQARELGRHLGLPMTEALARTRPTASQADLPAARRHANVRGAFAWRPQVAVKGRTIVLVDDVSTTGATLNACARVLLDAGAADVRALTAARAPFRGDGQRP